MSKKHPKKHVVPKDNPEQPLYSAQYFFVSTAKTIVALLSVVFLLANMYASQQIHPLYFNFIGENKDDVIKTLRFIQSLPEYPEVLAMQKNIYGSSIEGEVNQEAKIRDNSIRHLEEELKINPKARDVLYNLSILYKKEGNSQKSLELYRQALQVDPAVDSEAK